MSKQIEMVTKEGEAEKRWLNTILGGRGALLSSCGLAILFSMRDFGAWTGFVLLCFFLLEK